ncbi:hypothetical protein WN51_07012 [Melipona quadrifasciata]|uniref:Uncharacterized protein n=1 Tax=Melipona quadrifasciata TaxID=166423 RepID=A0A0M9AA39_9HYME|nr:hypothetical protein WN51_07012 [Melipona quadrifasciata]
MQNKLQARSLSTRQRHSYSSFGVRHLRQQIFKTRITPTEYKRKSNNRGLWTNEGLLDAAEAIQSDKMGMNAAFRDFQLLR